MKIKTLIASLIVALFLAGIFTAGISKTPELITPLSTIFSYLFIVAFLGGCLSSFWVNKPASPKKQKAHKPGKPINGKSKEKGKVKWFSASKGFGFITRDTGEDIFVHFRSILGKGHRVLQENQRVEFIVTEGDKGLQAEDVSPA